MEDYKKKYEEALEKARKYHEGHTLDVNPQSAMEYVFPELKESEDEKIRKTLIELIKGITSWNYFLGISKEQMIAWLEKQGSNVDNANKEYWRGYREGKQEIIDKYSDLEKQGKQKPSEWSYNDNLIIEKIILALKAFVIYSCGPKPNKTIDDLIEYLKSLKERMKGE